MMSFQDLENSPLVTRQVGHKEIEEASQVVSNEWTRSMKECEKSS